MMKYAVTIEKTERGYSAYPPDLPGCGAAGDTKEEVVRLIKDAIEFHIEGLRLRGEPVPPPRAACEYVEIEA